jgi:ribosomal protein S18 acetylase RimI-like enzyme
MRTASGAEAREGEDPSSNRLALTRLTLGGRRWGVCEGLPVTPAPDDRQRELFDILHAALPEDPFLRYDVEPGTFESVAVDPGHAAAWMSWHRFRGERWLTAIAQDPTSAEDVRRAVAVAVALADECSAAGTPVGGVTVPRGGLEQLPDRLRPPHHEEWDWWFIESAPDEVGPPVVDLDAADPRLEALLAVASPHAPIRPGNPRVARWAGVEVGADVLPDTAGLASLVAVTHLRSGAAHLNDVATHPALRGRRLARALCAQVTRDAFDEGRPAVSLGMYADNDAARSLYTALGFTCVRGNSSGPLARG